MTVSSDLPSTLPAPTSDAWLKHGQALEAEGHALRAIEAYDRAIAHHRSQLSDSDPATRRALGVALMNRGNALQKITEPESIAAAVHAYDEAIRWFETLPIHTEPTFRNHLGAAWLNRGHALIVAQDVSAALASFEHAIAHLEKLPLAENPFYRLNLAGAWTNCAHLQLASQPAAARTSARHALKLLSGVEHEAPAFAEMSLRARRALVTALGELLVVAESAHEPIAVLAAEASDAIDDGLALARAWETHGVASLRPLATRLFRLGAQLYRVHQPHFLGEFLLENLAQGAAFATDAEFQQIATEALEAALGTLERPRHFVIGADADEKLLATVHSLRAARTEVSAAATASVLTLPPSSSLKTSSSSG